MPNTEALSHPSNAQSIITRTCLAQAGPGLSYPGARFPNLKCHLSSPSLSKSSSALKSCFLRLCVCAGVGGAGMGRGTSHKLSSSLVTHASQFKIQWQIPCRPGRGANIYILLSAKQKVMFHCSFPGKQINETMRKWTNKWMSKLAAPDRCHFFSCLFAHERFIHNSQRMETTHVSISVYPWWMDKQNVLCSDTRTLLSHTKEWSAETCYELDEPQECHSELKKPDTKAHILYVFT